MAIDLFTPSYWLCVGRKQWQNASAIRGCSIDRVRMDHDRGYMVEAAKPVQVEVKPVAMRWPAAMSSMTHSNLAQRRQWAVATNIRRAAAGVTLQRLADESGYTLSSVQVNFAPTGRPSLRYISAIDAALARMEGLHLPALHSPSAKVTPEWSAAFNARRRAVGASWADLAVRVGYTEASLRTVTRIDWHLPVVKREAIERALGFGCASTLQAAAE